MAPEFKAAVANWCALDCSRLSAVLQSETGNHLLAQTGTSVENRVLDVGADLAIVWYFDRDGYHLSLRSRTDLVDVGSICQRLGGGGHKRAAGCVVNRSIQSLFVEEHT